MDSISILLPACFAGLLIIATHVPLGLEVIKRGIIFIDLAVAQIAALGVIIASLYFHTDEHPWITQIIALLFALASSYGFLLCEKHLPEKQEAIIGSAYVFASSLALLLLANHPHGAEQVATLLSGQLLWVNWQHILYTALIYLPLLFCLMSKNITQKGFYFIFALAITVSVQLAGVFLVFASLILPAIAALMIAQKRQRLTGYTLACLSLIIGLALSLVTDLPSGPLLVCVMTACTVVSITYKKITS